MNRKEPSFLAEVYVMTVLTKVRSILSAWFGLSGSTAPAKTAGIADCYLADRAADTADQSSVTTASNIGFAVGATGGNVVDAAQLQYVLSCVVASGQRPTSEQIGRAVGMLGGSLSEAIMIEELSKNKKGEL